MFRFFRPVRGSALTLSIVVSVVVTGLVMALAWTAGEGAQRTGSMSKSDQAFYAAEAGAQRVAWFCKKNQMSSITSPLTGTVNGYTYSVSWSTGSGNTVSLTSVGNSGAVYYTLSETVTPPVSATATFASYGDFDNKNITVTGDVMTGGNYLNSGNGSLIGNLTYGGTASNTSAVTGTVTKSSFVAIDFSALDGTLRNRSTTTAAAGTGTAINFNNVNGTRKVIYVNGDLTDPVITGSGTLYVNGNVHFTSSQNLGTSSSPLYLVATGGVAFDKSMTFYGAIYAKGDLTRSQVNIHGLVYVGGFNRLNSGQSDMTATYTTTPWFDPRTSSSTASVTTFSNFSGPMP